ncbi:hypothetical protein EV693_101146 [Nicoletella semolina]|uniref:DUF5363 family protein n=1 Tax=Nicoletella semolina TaxID=271160 RepID=A0A4R2NCN9_9PAST|nr:DUF5363 family protein [Nicoletella semolina]TCP18880.1 hypothetical protein EV693_101146 [Nicoletella semolina]
MSENTHSQKSLLRKWLDKYNDFCKDLGVEQGACRGCVPVVKFDPDSKKAAEKQEEKK